MTIAHHKSTRTSVDRTASQEGCVDSLNDTVPAVRLYRALFAYTFDVKHQNYVAYYW
jgi:hypothetical protein